MLTTPVEVAMLNDFCCISPCPTSTWALPIICLALLPVLLFQMGVVGLFTPNEHPIPISFSALRHVATVEFLENQRCASLQEIAMVADLVDSVPKVLTKQNLFQKFRNLFIVRC